MVIIYNERLTKHGITDSTETAGGPYGNALAENVNGSHKNKFLHPRRWTAVDEVETATFEWVNWWSDSKIHQFLGCRTPAEVEPEFWSRHLPQESMEIKANT